MSETKTEAQEAYKLNDKNGIIRVVVVHERKDGQVYFHLQKWDDLMVSFASFYRAEAEEFANDMRKDGWEKFDPAELPCNSQPMPDDGWGPL